jgi:hypothetical protein
VNLPHKRLERNPSILCTSRMVSRLDPTCFFYIIKLSLSGDKFAGSEETVRTGHQVNIDDKVTVGRMVCRIFLEQENFSRETNSSNYYFEEVLGLERNKEGKENPGNYCYYFLCSVFLTPCLHLLYTVLRNKIIFGGGEVGWNSVKDA